MHITTVLKRQSALKQLEDSLQLPGWEEADVARPLRAAGGKAEP